MNDRISRAYQLVHALAARGEKYSTRHLSDLEASIASSAEDLRKAERDFDEALAAAERAAAAGNDDELCSRLGDARLRAMDVRNDFSNLVDELSELFWRRSVRVSDRSLYAPVRGDIAVPGLMDFRSALVGKMVESSWRKGVDFEGQWKLELLGEAHVSGSEECIEDSFFCFVDAHLVSFTGDDSVEVLTFDNGGILTVPFGNAPTGSKSMMLHGPGGLTVFWN